MLSLKWGDILSMLLPGVVALFALAPFFPLLGKRLEKIDQAGPAIGVVLLVAAALAGGVLEAITRIAWEPLWLLKRCRPEVSALSELTPANLDLYERGVQSSYKYVTFYANFAWATFLFLISRWLTGAYLFSFSNLILMVTVAILLRASHVQWTYFVNYQEKVFAKKEVPPIEAPVSAPKA